MYARPLTPIACVAPAPAVVSLVTCSYTVSFGTWRIAARARRSTFSPGTGGHGTASDVVPPVQPAAAAWMVSRLSPRAHRAGATKQPGPQPRTASALALPCGPASVMDAVSCEVAPPLSCGADRCTTTCPALAPSGTTGPLAGGGNGSAPPELASDGAAKVLSSAVTASTPASTPGSTLVASAGPAPGCGRRRSHNRPATASAAASATRAALMSSTRP